MEIPFTLIPQRSPHASTMLVVHDGAEYAAQTSLLELVDDTTAVALLDPPGDRMDVYACDEEYARELPWLVGHLRDTHPQAAIVGVGASLGALAMMHAHAHHGLLDAMMLQSGSFFRCDHEHYESGFRHFDRVARFVDELGAGATGPTVPTTITCGLDEQNLACNQALAALLADGARPPVFAAYPGGHDWPDWDGALREQLHPLLHELGRPPITPLTGAVPGTYDLPGAGLELGA